MRRAVISAALAVLALAAISADAASPGFRYGVAAGEVTSTSAVLWTRTPKAGSVSLNLGRPGRSFPLRVYSGVATRRSDLTVSWVARGLQPGTTYTYFFVQGETTSPVGRFETAPLPTSAANVRFAISGDADATQGTNGKPGFNRFEVYARMAAERNDFNINLGDTIYSDSEINGTKPALTVPAKWEKYKLGLALPTLHVLRQSAGLYSHWDDHEFINDFSRAENGAAIYAAGVKAFRDYAPVAKPSANGLYRTFRWGKHVELFFLDERSFRS
ncbi:MAG: glycerophosphoryl diester phosphodiesterase, partial [Thermoleophilia bacterium]|nr:glycerophosphoryl diester phosphodiesterase [Thermoleophilia bacterium]